MIGNKLMRSILERSNRYCDVAINSRGHAVGSIRGSRCFGDTHEGPSRRRSNET